MDGSAKVCQQLGQSWDRVRINTGAKGKSCEVGHAQEELDWPTAKESWKFRRQDECDLLNWHMVSASNWSHPIKQPLAAGSGSWDAPVVRSADDGVEDADPSWETLGFTGVHVEDHFF